MEESHDVKDNHTKTSYIDKKKVIMLVSASLLILVIVISVTVTTSKNSFSNIDESPIEASGKNDINHDTLSINDKRPKRQRIRVHSKVEDIGVHRIQFDGKMIENLHLSCYVYANFIKQL